MHPKNFLRRGNLSNETYFWPIEKKNSSLTDQYQKSIFLSTISLHIELHLLGELLGECHKIETIQTLNIYIPAYQDITRSLHQTPLFGPISRNIYIECFYCFNLVILT